VSNPSPERRNEAVVCYGEVRNAAGQGGRADRVRYALD
jgi:hypothetical protein